MIKTKSLLHFYIVYFLLSVGPLTSIAQSSSVSFSFSLPSAATTSAGVFMKDSTLVKTLWSNVNYSGGTHTAIWDGTDDQGNIVATNNYDIRVLSNNVTYTWEGVIGNTSASKTGNTVFHSYQNIWSMSITGSTAYCATNYNENTTATFKFNTSSVQSKTAVTIPGNSGVINFIANDNTNVYWAGADGFNTATSFVYATRTIDDQQVSFSNGKPLSLTYSSAPMLSCIDIGTNANAVITGLAVQKKGNFLFVSHQMINQINVFNKTTGALIKSVSITAPTALATDGNDNLWITTGNSVIKYGVNADGSLQPAVVTLSGFASPLAIAVSPDNNTVVIADGGNSQQIKAFNNNNGAASWTYGQAGGYATDATVTNDKFYFSDLNGINRSFLAFAPDGSFWIGDPGNNRSIHLDAGRNYLERVMYMPHFYGCTVDVNDPTRAFADYLEFKIDYSKGLDPNNGSWTLVKNWGYNVTAAYQDQSRFHSVATLSNGRTYGLIRNGNVWAVVELISNGGLRITGLHTKNLDCQLYPDGSLKTGLSFNSLGVSSTFLNQSLVGFDGSNNPQWGPATIIATSPPATIYDPLYSAGNSTITSSNIAVAFDAGLPPSPFGSAGFHLGGIKLGTSKWLWRTAPVTNTGYTGPFPTDGSYDIGNGVKYAGSVVMALDRTVIWGYHGEFWKNSETNKWNQVYDDGLMVGQFGITGPETNGVEAASMMAGNALSAAIVKDASGNAYLYHCDESDHGGLHRWKITGLNTIQEQTIPVVWADSSHGLLGEYMDGGDLNNLNTKTTRVDKSVNFSWGSAIPSGTQITSASNFSVRWTGYVIPNYSENYVFNFNTANKVRLWINDSLLLDQWNNSSQNSFNSTPINLKAGSSYAIVIEYSNTSVGGGALESLSWSSPSQLLQVIPTGNLYPALLPDTANGLDLMRGLHFRKTLANNLYGWGRTPAQEDISHPQYSEWWSVQSGFQTVYSPTGSPDVAASFTQPSNTYTVTRDLGTYSSNLNSWKLSGVINYLASNLNFGSGGMYLEVLDVSGKVITRFQVTSSFGSNPSMSVIANSTNLVTGTTGLMNPVVFQNQPIAITYANGKATFQYSNYAPVSVPIFDATGNGLMPKTMRLYFYQNGSPYYNREIDLASMRFSPNGKIVAPPPNQPPVAVTGAATTITLPTNSTTLDGSKSYDPDGNIMAYGWVLLTGTGGTIVTPTSSTTTVTGLAAGTYIYKLTVTDDSSASAYALDTVYVKAAANLPPIANAGADQTITLPVNTVTVDGSASKDQDNGGTISSWSWIQSSGPPGAIITSPTTAITTITGLQSGVYVFKLQVTDSNGATAYDSLFVTVKPATNLPPVANAGTSKSIILPVNTVNLDGSLSSDSDGTIVSYSWVQISGPSTSTLTNPGSVVTAANNLVAGQYIFGLTVTDNSGAVSKAQVKITVVTSGPQPPVANAGANQTITLPVNQVNMDGSASVAPSGNIVSYTWTQISGPSTATLTAATSAQTNATGLIAGTYQFQLAIVDNNNVTAKDSVTITVNPATNIPPVANAGASVIITLPANSTTLNGSKSSDADGTITSYSWTEISGPNTPGSTGVNSPSLSLTGLVAGQYIYQLTVTDNNGATGSAQVKVTVVAPANNIAPVANAGSDQRITAPVSSVNLNGSASYDPDGTIAAYSWVLISGQGSVTISNANTATPSVMGLVPGAYVFQLTVTDNSGATNAAQVAVTVLPASTQPNQNPVANAGGDQTITAPMSSVSLNGSASHDPDGTIATYSWVLISGQGSVTISNANTATPSVTGLVPGVYVFQLTVTDNSGATNTAQVTVTVNPASTQPNQNPVANAGNNLTITAPVNSVTLNGSSSFDPDGTIQSYLWSEVSGPSNATISNTGSVSPTVSGLVVGVYVFQLQVTDNDGATNTDQVTVNVQADVNKLNLPPVAIAGPDTTIYLPANSYILNGQQSYDPDGTIVSYQWQQINGPNMEASTSMNGVQVNLTNMQAGAYQFQLTVTDNQGSTSTAVVKVSVDDASALADQIILFPNPAHDVITGKITSAASGTVKVTVFDMNGRTVMTDETVKSLDVYEKTFNISALASGTYIVQVNIGYQKVMVAKFIKM
jgi:PA14 domain/PKD domain/Secretion system C-terminal sorting domain